MEAVSFFPLALALLSTAEVVYAVWGEEDEEEEAVTTNGPAFVFDEEDDLVLADEEATPATTTTGFLLYVASSWRFQTPFRSFLAEFYASCICYAREAKGSVERLIVASPRDRSSS